MGLGVKMSGNLQFIKEFNSTESMSTASLTDCFNADYDTYEIYVTHLSSSSNVMYLYGRLLDSSNNVISANEYDYSNYDMHSDTSYTENFDEDRNFFFVTFAGGVNYHQMGGLKLTVFSPYQSDSHTMIKTEGALQDSLNNNHLMGSRGVAMHFVNETIKGIQFLPNSGTFDEGMKFKVYGVK